MVTALDWSDRVAVQNWWVSLLKTRPIVRPCLQLPAMATTSNAGPCSGTTMLGKVTHPSSFRESAATPVFYLLDRYGVLPACVSACKHLNITILPRLLCTPYCLLVP